eukprot:12939003-Prorocentrum_lima.AAC.1
MSTTLTTPPLVSDVPALLALRTVESKHGTIDMPRPMQGVPSQSSFLCVSSRNGRCRRNPVGWVFLPRSFGGMFAETV